MSHLATQQETVGPVTVLSVSGRVDSANAKELETEVVQAVEAGTARMVFNFSDLDYISSAGLRVVLIAGKRLKAAGGGMALYGLNPTIKDVFEISGFMSLFEVKADRDAAIAAVG
ncbi:MAG: STAS domain-containing protein [Pseudomonadota bacterium]